MLARLGSLLALVLIWQAAAHFSNPRLLPAPLAVVHAIVAQTASGDLPRALGATLARVVAAFALSMTAGSALGYAMGRRAGVDRWLDAPIVVLLNLPALVIIVLAYIWIGLNEAAAIVAVALNKLPNAVVTLREGARTLDRDLDEMAAVFGFSAVKRWRHVVLPQLAPFFAAATRSGLSLVWKIVLVVELLGRPNGVGFEIGTAFQLFDVAMLLAYALPFTAIMLAIETFLVQPFERHAARWRPRPA